MDLKSLVRINDEGLVADAVNFDMMDDAEKNLSLCQGFVFNYDQRKPKDSTAGVLDLLRRSFFSRSEPNVHLIVQDYGKGKSHFALVIANYFCKLVESPEVHGILHQLDIATEGKGSLAEDLRVYKQRSQSHLVIRISGEKEHDLRQMFLRAIRRTLEAEGVTETIAQHLCDRPLQYVETFTAAQKVKADSFLRHNSAAYGEIDTDAVIKLLRGQDYRSIQTVVDISRELTNGFAVNFEADINIEEILNSLINTLCVGETRRYQGIVILFDELHAYLHDSWVPNPARAGGMALQNITNACENHKGQIALVCFTQIRPLAVQPADGNTARTYQKLATRLELAPSTYEPMASLELVLDALINVQSPASWTEFTKEWGPALRSDSESVYQKYITIYKDRGWPHTEFFQHLTLGCFPLHPLTSYLLCNLDFTQGRTAVQFIKEDVKQFIAREPVDKRGFPNYLYATQLVDAFQSNLSNHASYSDFARAMTAVTASADDDDRTVLKSLFLFYVSGTKLHKADSELHNELIGALSGLSSERIRVSLARLTGDLGIIYPIPKNNTYRFYAGLGLSDLKKAIENEVSGIAPAIEDVVKYCQSNAELVLGGGSVEGQRFVSDNRLDKKDWTFEIRACSTQTARLLMSGGSLGSKSHGLLAYVVPASGEDAMSFSSEVMDLLAASPAKERLIVALPSGDLSGVAKTLLLLKTLRAKSAAEREKYGEAYSQLQKLWEQEVLKRLTETFRSCEFRHPVVQTLAVAYRDDRQEIVSTLLDKLYPFTPPLENVDKLRGGHSTGAQIVTFAVKQLFGNTLSRQNLPNASYATVIDSVLVQRWGLLTLSGNRYSVQEPKDRRVQTAWKRLSEIFDLKGEKERRVSLNQVWREMAASPYGYNELTFVCLVGAWLVHHRREVALGARGKKPDGSPTSAEVSLLRFVAPEGNFDKAFGKPKDFLAFFTSHETSFLIRREPVTEVTVPEIVPYDDAEGLVSRINEFLNQDTPDRSKAGDLQRKKREIEEGVQVIEKWIQPISDVINAALPSTINGLAAIYSEVTREPEEFASGVVVEVSREQLARQVSAINNVTKAIETVVESYRTQASTLKSEVDFNALLSHVEREHESLMRVTVLAAAFGTQLTDIKLLAQRRNEELLQSRALRQEVEKLQRLLVSLNSNSSELALTAARRALDDSAASVPGASSTKEFRSTIDKIDKFVKALADGLLEWQKTAGQLRSSKDANRLRQEIEARRERYDSEAGMAQCVDLLARLAKTAEDLGRTEELEQTARRKVDMAEALWRQIKGLADVPSAIGLYDELAETAATVPTTFPLQAAGEIRKIEVLAKADIVAKVGKLCSGKLTTIPELNRRSELLSQIQPGLLSRSAFTELAGAVDAAISALTEDRKRLVEADEDRQVLGLLRQVRPNAINSLAGCREKIEEINGYLAMFHEKANLPSDVGQILPGVRARAEAFVQQLKQVREGLPLVMSLDRLGQLQRTYNQLDLVFRGSELEEAYTNLDAEFICVKEDLETLKALESAASDVGSVIKVRATIDSMSAVEPSLHHAGRYGERLQGIRSKLTRQLEAYSNSLSALEEDVNVARTPKDAERVWEKIVDHRTSFLGSELEGRYSRLRGEAEALVAFMRIQRPVTTLASEQECTAALNAVAAWQASATDCTARLLGRATLYRDQVLTALTELRAAGRRIGEAWLLDITDQSERLRSEEGDPNVVVALSVLLERITLESIEHVSFLGASEAAQIDAIRTQCEAFLESDRESKILFLVSQLPAERQAVICRTLAEILHLQLVQQ